MNTSNKMLVVYFFYLLIALLAVGKIVYLQFFSDYKNQLESIVYRTTEIPAGRGSILGYDGRVLATTVPFYEIRMDCSIPDDDMLNRNLRALAVSLSRMFEDKSATDYEKYIATARTTKKPGYRNLPLGNRLVSHDELLEIRGFPVFNLGKFRGGLIVNQKDKRIYPYGRLAYRTIGYISDNEEAGVGIEYAYNTYLKGHPGSQRVRRRSGEDIWVPVSDRPEQDPKNGLDILTTLDINIQGAAENALREQLSRDSIFEGATAVVMEVRSGAVRAIVNMKKMKNGSYDETFNYAISESTNPGSTFKLATLIALLEDGYVHLTDSVKTGKGGWRYYGKLFTEATSSLGTITVQQAFEKSSNVAFAMLAVEKYGTQEKRFINRLYNMKLNEKLNIELIGEGRATIPFPGEPGWSKLSLPMIAMGYEMQLTPLHILTFYNAIANNGRMVTPYFIESFLQHGKVTEHFEHTPLSGTLCTPGTLKAVHQALRGVVEHGTASRIHDSRYSISGKTGTAQIAYDGAYVHNGYRKHQASFVGFFPSDDPMYSMIVILYSNPTRSNFYGASWAAPVFKKIADHIYTTNPFWNAPLDEINLTHTNP
ncbi:MAG: penicillin-binding protein 2 [Bacteroidales bacterium]|jgi:cell division protein FtsI (penicillin-binding protein 3)|nr:penicillin-binding protein 2 [Bacteroidales bacterium]NLK79952.1 penicillin-binding protein 2 [Bacteroidales bacterium]HKM30933.1 penicillin-binding protein 2 [Bacteroidales bacterium]HPX79442.1 penicillin-binding protein 2 [Bacteroidales bacterium]